MLWCMALESRIHQALMRSFVDRGCASSAEQIAADLQVSCGEVVAGLHRLHAGHGLVLHPGSNSVWVAHPFSASPTGVWVASGSRGWWAPCIWCGLGIVALAAPDADVHLRIAGESKAATILLRDGQLASEELVIHFPIPARHAWDNVVHWCATVLPFERAEDVAPWCARHELPQGAILPLRTVFALAQAWYGPYLEPDWEKWTRAEAQAIFERVGLQGEHWQLPPDEGVF
jgi:hypothetical protein